MTKDLKFQIWLDQESIPQFSSAGSKRTDILDLAPIWIQSE